MLESLSWPVSLTWFHVHGAAFTAMTEPLERKCRGLFQHLASCHSSLLHLLCCYSPASQQKLKHCPAFMDRNTWDIENDPSDSELNKNATVRPESVRQKL